MTQSPPKQPADPAPTSVLREVLLGVLQPSGLMVATISVVVLCVLVVFGMRPVRKAERDNAKSAEAEVRRIMGKVRQVELKRSYVVAAAKQRAARLDQEMAELAKAEDVVRRSLALEQPEVWREVLATRLSEPASAADFSLLHELRRRALTGTTMLDFGDRLSAHVATDNARLEELAALAVRWRHVKLADAVVSQFANDPQRYSQAIDFRLLGQLGRVSADRRLPALMLDTVSDRLSFDNRGTLREAHRVGKRLAGVSFVDGPLMARHVLKDSPRGDVVRAALFHTNPWPPEVLTAVTMMPSALGDELEQTLVAWLQKMPPPETACEAWFPAAAKRIPRQSGEDADKAVHGLDLLVALLARPTLVPAARLAIELEAANPRAARRLAAAALAKDTGVVVELLARANGGRGMSPPEERSLSTDAGIAWFVLDQPTQVTPDVESFVASWAGPQTAAVLGERLATLPPDDAQAALLRRIVDRVEGADDE